jgi:hypothetical protein
VLFVVVSGDGFIAEQNLFQTTLKQKGSKVFDCAQIISLLNTEQNCGWVELDLVSNPDLTQLNYLTSSSVVSVVGALMNS